MIRRYPRRSASISMRSESIRVATNTEVCRLSPYATLKPYNCSFGDFSGTNEIRIDVGCRFSGSKSILVGFVKFGDEVIRRVQKDV